MPKPRKRPRDFNCLAAAIVAAVSWAVPVPGMESYAIDNSGFLYGTVSTRSGKEYHGFLRWGDEESFWDDLFHSSKEELPYLENRSDDERESRRRRPYRFFGHEVHVGDDDARIFICRFGDIAEIEVLRNDHIEVHLKSGVVMKVRGYSNDVSDAIHVLDPEVGGIEVEWDRIERIRFAAAPTGADPGVTRLHGTVTTDSGAFEGWVQWDKSECTSVDLLNGESEDGKVEIPMGRIRSIERLSRRACNVTLADGRTLRLEGSNDVNDDNRGIVVEDERHGRVTISWRAFDKLTFSQPGASGRGYAAYPPLGPLEGSVHTTDGGTHRGHIVFDRDEEAGWEMLNGSHADIEYDIPFARIASIEPGRHDESRVVLRGGLVLELEDAQDVSERNAGVYVVTPGRGEPQFFEWSAIERIEFEP